MNRDQLVKALVARKLTSGDKNKIICGCHVLAENRGICVKGGGRSAAGKRS